MYKTRLYLKEYPSRPSPWKKWIIFYLIIFIFSTTVSGTILFTSKNIRLLTYASQPVATLPTPTESPSSTLSDTTPTTEPTLTPAPPVVNTVGIKNAVQEIVDLHPELTIGVSFIDLHSGLRTDVNGNTLFTAASTTKVLIACLLLSQVEEGKYTLDRSVDGKTLTQHLQLMINQSNNDSWNSLIQFIGMNYQLPYAQKIGITSYDPINNNITPNDMALLLAQLYSGNLLSTSDRTLLLSYMQNTNDESIIPPAVPNGITVYHKYGNIDDNLHDTAIIDNGKNPFILAIYSSGSVAPNSRLAVIHQIVTSVENSDNISTAYF